MYILASNMWFSTLIRQFFYSIDKIVYNFIPAIYDLLISIARTSVLTQGDIASMADRIYKLLAVFMVFKVTFSLIMYVVNPDDFSDKNKGIGKLGTNIVISLALLILTPYIFTYAYQLQTIILEDNALGTLIFGDESDENFLNNAGDNMAYITLSPFFTPNVSLIELYECSELVEKDTNGNVHFNESCSGIDSIDYEDLGDDSSMRSLLDVNFDETDLKNYVAGVEANSMPLMFRQNMATATTTKSAGTNNEQEFIMDYKWGFSTAVGVVIVLLLVTFCMDVALRSIKLAFLQLIAPIPIISYVDPKSGKDGLFKKWVDMCVKTFLSLFIRLLALYFAVYIIGKVADLKMVDIIDGSYVSSGLIAIFIIVGALMFAKNFTKILEGLGIKLDGDGKFFLNPFKKFEEQAAGGKRILGAGKGIAAGAMVGTAGMLTGAGLGRGVLATFGGLKSGLQGKKFGEIRKDQATKNAEMRRAIASGSTFWGRTHAQLSGYFGTPGALGNVEHDKIATQNKIDNYEAQKKIVKDKIAPKKAVISKQQAVKTSVDKMESYVTGLIEGGKAGSYSAKYKQLGTDLDYLTNNIGQKSDHDITNADGKIIVSRGTEITGIHAQALNGETQRYSKKIARKDVMNELLEGKSKGFGGEVGADDLRNFQAQWRSYESDVASLNKTIVEEYLPTATEDDIKIEKVETKTTFDSLHAQSADLDVVAMDIQTKIKDRELEIEQIDRNIESEQVKLQEYNAKEKVAKSNIEVTHSTQGGPAHPGDIKPANSTVGRRTGGPGSGMGPMGPMGPGGGPGGK